MRQHRKAAFTLVEVTGALVLFASVLAAVVPLALLVQTQGRESAAHHQALQAADNLLERILALEWQVLSGDLSAETIGADELVADIPGGTWNLAVVEESNPLLAKRVTVSVSYRSRGTPGAVRLTAWKYFGVPGAGIPHDD